MGVYLYKPSNGLPDILLKQDDMYWDLELKYCITSHKVRVLYNSMLEGIIIWTDYPEPDLDEPIEMESEFVMLCGEACDFYRDYLIDLAISIEKPNLGADAYIQLKIDLVNQLKNYLCVS